MSNQDLEKLSKALDGCVCLDGCLPLVFARSLAL